MQRIGWLTALVFLFITSTPAFADVPPSPGYREKCTVNKQQKRGEECVSCGDAYHGAPDACRERLEPEGYSHRCNTRGASTWDEVWCRPQTGDAAAGSAEKGTVTLGCQLHPQGSPGGRSGALVVLVACWIVVRRVGRFD